MKCIKCNSKNVMGVEYLDIEEKIIPFEHQYDGISEWSCQDCGTRWGRWSNRELKGDDYERKNGEDNLK